MELFVRAKENPILVPKKDSWWESRAVFNPSAAKIGDKVYLLYRAIGNEPGYISRIGLAISYDGIHFERFGKEPVLKPDKVYDRGAVEDPKIIYFPKENRYYVQYAAHKKPPGSFPSSIATAALATTNDFKRFKKHGLCTSEKLDNRYCLLFPEKINGHYVSLQRPQVLCKEYYFKKRIDTEKILKRLHLSPKKLPEKPAIWIAFSKNKKNWKKFRLLFEGENWWEKDKIGPSLPPIKTKFGWLIIYHGVDKAVGEKGRTYRIGAVMLNKNFEVIARFPEPIFEPKEEYEITGDVANATFVSGYVLFENKKNENFYIYYGGADTVCCVAFTNFDYLIEELMKNRL